MFCGNEGTLALGDFCMRFPKAFLLANSLAIEGAHSASEYAVIRSEPQIGY